jgi:hypothetical protein
LENWDNYRLGSNELAHAREAGVFFDGFRTLERRWMAEQESIEQARGRTNVHYPDTSLNQEYHRAVDQLRSLPRTDSKLTREVYGMFASSPESTDRELIAGMIPEIMPVDTEASVEHWKNLLTDPNGDVVDAAYDSFLHAIESQPDLLNAQQVASLFRSYMNHNLEAKARREENP